MPYLTFRTFLPLAPPNPHWQMSMSPCQLESSSWECVFQLHTIHRSSSRGCWASVSLKGSPFFFPVALIQDVRKCTKKANRARTFSRSNQRLFLTFLGMFLLLLAPALAACVWIMHFQSLPSQFQLQNGISQGSQRPTAAYLIELGIKWSSMSLGQMESLRTDEDGSTFLLLLPLFL